MSSTIASGSFVRLVTDPSQAGMVRDRRQSIAGVLHVEVQFANGAVKFVPAENLEPVSGTRQTLGDRLETGRFVSPSWLRRTLTRIRVTGRVADIIYSMEATKTDFYPHQFKPVLKLLGSPTDALLIADEVGMGKTIEAGLIWTELRARFECNRLLVVCPKTLCAKWRDELDRRFGVAARIVDAGELHALLSGRSGARGGFAAIAGMQALRPPRGWESDDHRSDRAKLARFLTESAEGDPLLDMLAVDEAHHLRNPNTLTHRLGILLNSVATHRIFLSATPIHLRSRDLHSLLKLIDPYTFEYERTVDELIRVNEPIVKARDLLMRGADLPVDAVTALDAAGQSPLLKNSRSLADIRRDLANHTLGPRRRAELASRLETVHQMANFVTRSRRKDVEAFKLTRRPAAPALEMNIVEREFYKKMTDEVKDYAESRDANERFLLSTTQRLLTSSPAAASAYWSARNIEDNDAIEETDDDLAATPGNSGPLTLRLSALAKSLNMTAALEKDDTKFELLRSQLVKIWRSEDAAKVIVFSSFKPTLNYLRRRLERLGVMCELLHGSVNEPREAILQRFRDDSSIRILLSSEVGSEGVDLQFCWIVVNYDLPWNPMRVEQRVGRVDRLGQERDVVRVINLIYDRTIDAIIYDRLYNRLELIQRALGEFEALLGERIFGMTAELLRSDVGEAAQKEIVDKTAIAVETKRLETKKLEESAGALIRHGDYVLRKITDAKQKHRWLDGDDIRTFVMDQLDRSFRGCKIESAPPGSEDTFRIELTMDAQVELANFVRRNGLTDSGGSMLGGNRRRYRFTSSVAERAKAGIEPVSRNHPLVRFAVELADRDDDASHAQPVAAAVGRRWLDAQWEIGIYVIGMHYWSIGGAEGREQGEARVAYVGAGPDGASLLVPDHAEAMAATAAKRGKFLPNFGADPRAGIVCRRFRDIVEPELKRLYAEFIERTRSDIQDRAAIRTKSLDDHFADQKAKLNELVVRQQTAVKAAEAEGDKLRSRRLTNLVSATKGRIARLEQRFELRRREIAALRTMSPLFTEVACLIVEVTP